MTSYDFDDFDPDKYLQQYVWDKDVLELGTQNMKWMHDMFKQCRYKVYYVFIFTFCVTQHGGYLMGTVFSLTLFIPT